MNTVIDFLTKAPNSNKAQITEGTGIKGLPLFNLLKQMMKDGQIVSAGEGTEMTYTLTEPQTEEVVTVVQPIVEGAVTTEETIVEPTVESAPNNEEINETQSEPLADVVTDVKAEPAKNTAGRNTGTFKFNGASYNKGKLIHAVVAAHVTKNKNITQDKLKEAFPDSLLKRFGIFQTVEKAREISGAKYDRYFFKDEMQIKLKDAVVVTCNQITGENILPFIEACAKLGFMVEAE